MNRMNVFFRQIIATTILLSFSILGEGFTATKEMPKKAVVSKVSPIQNNKILFDGWYTVTVGDGLKWGYYNDRFEQKDGRIFSQNHFWKKGENSIYEEHLGSFVNSEFQPLFFNFQGFLKNGSPIKMDGTAQPDGLLSVRMKKGNQEFPIVQKQIKGNYFFSGVFPIWLQKNLSSILNGKGKLEFQTVLEDNSEGEFEAIKGSVQLEKEDVFAKSSQTRKISVSYQVRSFWYLDSEGWPVRIEMLTSNPEESTLVDRVTEEKAKKFLSQ